MSSTRLKQGAGLLGAIVMALLAACGGGGESGSGGHYFSLDRTSAQLNGRIGRAPPVDVIHLKIMNTRAVYVGAGYQEGVPEANWLGVNIVGTGVDYDVILTGGGQPAGSYQATLTVGVADANGKILETRDIAVAYVVKDALSIEDTSQTDGNFVLGSSTHTQLIALPVSAGQLQWTAASDADWLQLSGGTAFSGDATLSATIDADGLSLGEHVATVTISDSDDPTETAQAHVRITVAAPELVAPDRVVLGGPGGLDRAPQTISFSLGTGVRAHSWRLTPITGTGEAWLVPSSSSGDVSEAGVAVELSANPLAVRGGIYEGVAHLEVNVEGVTLQKDIAVTYSKEPERLFVQYEGLALAKLPSRSVLNRDVRITSTYGRIGVPWTANSNASWLSVTDHGMTGDLLSVTASPDNLPVNQTAYADITVSSSDGLIENTQTIHVGLWVGSSDPTDLMPDTYGLSLAVSPVAPLLFVAQSDGSSIDAINFYTGETIHRYTPPHPILGEMYVSGDGQTLYALTEAEAKTYAFDIASGAQKTGLSYSDDYLALYSLSFLRPSALSTIYSGSTYSFDAATKQMLQYLPGTDNPGIGLNLASADGLSLYVADNAGVGRYTPLRSTLQDGGAGWTQTASGPWDDADPAQALAARIDGSQLYAAVHRGVSIYDGATLEFRNKLPIPIYSVSQVAITWDGRLVAGGPDYSGDSDLWFFASNEEPVSVSRCAGRHSNDLESIVVSSDGLRYACSVSQDVDRTPLHLGSMP